MYHIANDKRAYKSAALIETGLIECLKKKKIQNISISDIHKMCGISRATFYRLFDTPEDVLAYKCYSVFKALRDKMTNMSFYKTRDIWLFFINEWINNSELLEMLIINGMMPLLYNQHMENIDMIKKVMFTNLELDKNSMDYSIAILVGIIPSVFEIWYAHGKRESAEELLDSMKNTFLILGRM